jgi:hypothetical protein
LRPLIDKVPAQMREADDIKSHAPFIKKIMPVSQSKLN